MTVQTKTIGRMPTDHGPYDPSTSYGKKYCVTLYGCMWESLHDNNNTAPAVWDGGDTITPNTVDWKLVSGSTDAWLANLDKPASTGTTGDYPYNGLGRIVLKKKYSENSDYANQPILEQADFEDGEGNTLTNTVFVIKYDFVLTEDITLGSGCVLEFEGGSILGDGNNADTITGNGTGIVAGLVKIFATNVTLSGSWNVSEAYPEWFGTDGVDDTSAFQKAVNIGSAVILKNKSYVIRHVDVTSDTTINGNGATILHHAATHNQDMIRVTDAELIIHNIVADGNAENIDSDVSAYSLIRANTKGSLKIYDSTIKNTKGNAVCLGGVYTTVDRDEYAHDCVVENCKIFLDTTPSLGPEYDKSGDLILIEKCHNAVINNNIAEGGLSGIRCQYYCKNISITNNIVSKVTRDVGITLSMCEYCLVDSNTVHDMTDPSGGHGHAFEINATYNCKISNNVAYIGTGKPVLAADMQLFTTDGAYAGYVTDELTTWPSNHQNGVNPAFPNTDLVFENNIFKNFDYPVQLDCGSQSVIFRNNYLYKGVIGHLLTVAPGAYSSNGKLQLIGNVFDCVEGSDFAVGFYHALTCIGKNNILLNIDTLCEHPIFGENNMFKHSDRYYNNIDATTKEASLKININSTFFFFKPIPATPFIVRLKAKANIADNTTQDITIAIQEVDKNTQWVTNVQTGWTLTLTNTYKTFYTYVMPSSDPVSYDNFFELTSNNVNGTDVYIKDVEIFTVRKYDIELNSVIGTTSLRNITETKQGGMFFDTTLGKPVWKIGNGWVYADGTPVT